ncbi:MAG: transglutaminase-like domain-containing protein [Paracoccaceae bacterium]
MDLSITVKLKYRLPAMTDLLLQIEAAHLPEQAVSEARLDTSQTTHFARIPVEGGFGERIWIRADGEFECSYAANVAIHRPAPDISQLSAMPPHLLPAESVRYLLPSRYCPSDRFQSFVAAEFGALHGGEKVQAMRDWIERTIAYVPGASDAQTTAMDSFVQRQGVCRDFAHLLITFARASSIPARFGSVFAPGVTPQDFHAIADVYLDGAWHPVDATGMATADEMARIVVGADAAETAFLTAFGSAKLMEQTVSVAQGPECSDT